MKPFPLPTLVADVGGTNARFALIAAHGDEPQSLGSVKTSDHTSFAAAARHVLARAGAVPPRSILVDGAGPVVGNEIKLTNADWRLVIDDIGRELGAESAMLLNDFEALSLSLPFLPATGLQQIGPRPAGGAGAKVVVGPGTGLGATTLIDIDGTYVPLPSECGMTDLGPVTATEDALWPHLERLASDPPESHGPNGRIYAEWLLSGSGLVRIYQAELRRTGREPRPVQAAAVGEAAQAGSDAAARQAVDVFLGLLARYAGDLALVGKATGGVYLAGGVVQRLAKLIVPAEFRARFEAKTPLDGLMRDIATHLITLDVPAFIGLAALAGDPKRFHLAPGERLWQA